MTARRSVTLLGSTGSIGTQTIEVVDANPERFQITGIAAGGGQLDRLAAQAVALGVQVVAVASGERADVEAAIAAAAAHAGRAVPRPEILIGETAATELAGRGADIVLNGITGAIGLRPTIAALAAGSRLALANKESLIVGGRIVTDAAAPGQIVPVDSEHSAIAQCLRGADRTEIRRLIVTASGGPFRGLRPEQLREVTPAQALAHPTWQMGRVITTNSATLVNKGLEVIEAHLLFGVEYDAITVVVHPQSVVHSMVEFQDGSTIAKASPPSMLIPLALALSWPQRLDRVDAPCDWSRSQDWTFEPLDEEAFPAVRLAKQVGRAGGIMPAVYNAANEVCVDAFHDGLIRFTDIVATIDRVVDAAATHTRADNGREPVSVPVVGQSVDEDVEAALQVVLRADAWARVEARALLGIAPEEI